MNKPAPDTSKTPVNETLDSWETDRLVALAVRGDQEAFGQIVQAYYSRVYSVIDRVVRHPEDARELAQTTWVKAWQRLGDYHQDAKFYTWVYRIAVNTALDFLRKRKRRPEIPLEPAIGDDGDHLALDRQRELADERTAPDELHRAEIRQAFDQALGGLSDEHRTALILREVEGMSYEEIADVMKTRTGTVMSRLFYARKALRQTMEKFL
ncbi:MAG TPA: sigma-70 family RNA polymerase sigma factor [Kiritimatiellia bacterium]|nr:sigma-70 family RNA polymerase sigma factor [Kiritimatiellia bacterium]HMP00596.1 sigma-70 family RNA polymerase sigma factor [Kiritimatiellia bacterium]HMP98094.1 sigma-70 family RNA polymerase sigma factor [Kiritimatiellia bacterium]